MPATNRQSLLKELSALKALPGEWVQSLADRVKYLPDTNYKIATKMASEGKFKDAIFRLRIVLWLAPQHPPSWYLMGACLYSLGRHDEAFTALKTALKLNPQHQDTLFLMAAIDPASVPENRRPTTIPRAIAADYFDKAAPVYEAQQEAAGYHGHTLAGEAMRRYIETHRTNYDLLDIGCGTGLVGSVVKDVARRIVGVDFSHGMLDGARTKTRPDGEPIYDETLHLDLRDYLAGVTAPEFDVILAAHVFNYVGDIASVFDGVARALKEGGVFVFQVESYSGKGFGLIPKLGRFGHSQEYVQERLKRCGLELLEQRQVEVYPKYPLSQYVVRKPSGAS